MTAFSTSSIQKSFKYNVFLSFRGETRKTFVDHLFEALMLKNIETYKDDKNLDKGKRINKELIEAIKDSRFHIIVFSKNYASSSWCLDELVEIMECQKMQTQHVVYPIFYDVEPTEVRKQSGEFGKAFAKHKKEDDAEKWRKALEDASYFSGWDLRTTADGHEVDFIKLVVRDISLKLPVVSVNENLVGITTRINGVVSSLNAFPTELCMIGIWGMGGSGKTTLARAVFDQVSFQFEGIGFVANVREVSKSDFSGLKKLQQQVLRDVSNDPGIMINNVFDGKTMMKKKMPHQKVLVVLDDVDHVDQLKALAGEPNWFKPGSKVIITTRDKQVLVACKVNLIHDVNLLTDEEAICLLSRFAFGTESPIPGYEKLSKRVVSYAAGLPLTTTILGSSLCGAREHIWIDTLKELEKIPLDGTIKKLELSYVGLDTNCKEIFLDIICIMKGWKKEVAIRALESRGFHAIRGLSVLEKKSLIIISTDGCLEMHDHVQEMGKYIVRRLHPNEPNKHSRLWIHEEIDDILANNLGTEVTTCVDMSVSETNIETVMKGLRKMEKLRLLYVHFRGYLCNLEVDEVSKYFPNSLQYLNWWSYPLCFLPKTFLASNLVGLEMPFSKMGQLWEGGEEKVLHKLRFLRLCGSKLKTFDLGIAPNLEILDLEYCRDLVKVHMSVDCSKLKSLKLGYTKLRTLDVRLVLNIETLDLNGCQDLVKLDMPHECPQLKFLNISCPYLMSLNFGPTPNIEALKLEECDHLVQLDMSLECPQLESLYLRIFKLKTLKLRLTLNLETLKLQGCYNLVELHLHSKCCKLKTLSLECPMLRTFELGSTLNLETLTLNETDDLAKLLFFIGCPKLKYLKLINSDLRTLEVTLNLKTLILDGCYLVELHIPDGDVKLEHLEIQRCLKLKTLELTLDLKTLILGSSGLVELCIRDGDLKLEFVNISLCSKLKTLDLRRTPNLKSLRLNRCSSLVKLYAPIRGLKEFFELEAFLEGKLVDICVLHRDNKEDLPSSIENIENLVSEGFSCTCTDLESFFGSICGLHHLTKLTLGGSIPKAPKDLGRLQCLEVLVLRWSQIKHLPDNICSLKHLKTLHLDNCKLLEKLPEDLGRLECLETLKLEWCIALRDIPNSICRMKSLKCFSLYCCSTLKELPEELGRLECLKELNIEGTCIYHLPKGVLMLEGLYIHEREYRRRICCTML